MPDVLESHAPITFLPNVELSNENLPTLFKKNISLYIHIPFCLEKCSFCDFLVFTGEKVTERMIDTYLAGLNMEMIYFKKYHMVENTKVVSIQFGGGTPSILSTLQIRKVINNVFENFDCSDLKEIIFESFPTSITKRKLQELSHYGDVKFNMGVQSFDDIQLKGVGRPHTSNQAIEAIKEAVSSNISSVGIDLICGLPHSSINSISLDINKAIDLGVDHFAIYPLWLYPNTKLFNDVKNGRVEVSSYQERKERLILAETILESNGYEKYTIFHYKRRSEHYYGKSQMEDSEWIGLGVGSVSNFNGSIWRNIKNIRRYTENMQNNISVIETGFTPSSFEKMKRTLLSGMRLKEYDFEDFKHKYGIDMMFIFGEVIHALTDKGLLIIDEEKIRLTIDGVLRLNEIERCINKFCINQKRSEVL